MPATPSRWVRLLAAVVLAVFGVGLLQTGVALAKPKCPKPGAAQEASPYPPKPCKAAATPDRMSPGQKTFVEGSGFAPGELVRFELHSKTVVLGTWRATSKAQQVRTPSGTTKQVPAGWVGHQVTIPLTTLLGEHQITLEGLKSGEYLTADITVLPPGLPHGDPGLGGGSGGGSTGGLPFTGTQLFTTAVAGAAALAVGLMLLAAARRRRRAVALR
ncbi:MAG: hypothetical protein QOJ92_2877 [Frankiales bacterium]|nr:hypothetical protein [Frankiales bacterium]